MRESGGGEQHEGESGGPDPRGTASYFTASYLTYCCNAFTRPSIVCSFAWTVGFKPSSVRALEVSGPIEASFVFGCCLSNSGRLKRAWKFWTVELLVKVIQSAPASAKRAAAPLRSSVS